MMRRALATAVLVLAAAVVPCFAAGDLPYPGVLPEEPPAPNFASYAHVCPAHPTKWVFCLIHAATPTADEGFRFMDDAVYCDRYEDFLTVDQLATLRGEPTTGDNTPVNPECYAKIRNPYAFEPTRTWLTGSAVCPPGVAADVNQTVVAGRTYPDFTAYWGLGYNLQNNGSGCNDGPVIGADAMCTQPLTLAPTKGKK